MTYLLETNVLSDLLRDKEPVMTRFSDVRDHARFILCPVVNFEIRRYLLLKRATRNLAQYEALVRTWLKPAFAMEHWRQAAEIWAERHRIGKPIADADLLIAVSALQQDAILVTNNAQHFSDMGLRLEDWRQA